MTPLSNRSTNHGFSSNKNIPISENGFVLVIDTLTVFARNKMYSLCGNVIFVWRTFVVKWIGLWDNISTRDNARRPHAGMVGAWWDVNKIVGPSPTSP
jgi:hypothetical protein